MKPGMARGAGAEEDDEEVEEDEEDVEMGFVASESSPSKSGRG
jgi:hypothetical protein